MSNTVLTAYAAFSCDKDIRMKSSSGAIFSLLAEETLHSGGTVYGVAMSADCKAAEFIRVDHEGELYQLRGSKYLQARLGDTFRQVKQDLQNNLPVLFSGTGCQVNGLKAFLGKEYENLFCVDVICHGTPSPALWRKYAEHIEAEHGAKLIHVNFRCKDNSWSDFSMKEVDANHKEIFISKNVDPYMQIFLRDYALRPSCYACPAKEIKRSDMTIADFWGIDHVAPEMNDGKGISLVLVRTEAGKRMLDAVKSQLVWQEVSYEDGVKYNPAEFRSAVRPPQRDTFFSDMNSMTFSELTSKYAAPIPDSVLRKVKRGIKKMLMHGMRLWRKCVRGRDKTAKYGNYGLLFTLEKSDAAPET